MHDNQFAKEMALEAASAFRSGKMDRRTFLAFTAMTGVASMAVFSGDAEAAANEIVMWNWGGQSEQCHGDAIGKPFTAATGIPLKFDTSGPLQGKIKEMVDSGKVTADVCDADGFDAVALGKSGHLEPIDYNIVNKAQIKEGSASGKLSWGFGDARCAVDLKLPRAMIIEALTKPESTLQFPEHVVGCDIEREKEVTHVKLKLTPKVAFKDGKAVTAWVNLKDVEGPTALKGLAFSAAKLEDGLGIFHKSLIKAINHQIVEKCPKLATGG